MVVLLTIMKICFTSDNTQFPERGYDAKSILRPAFNFGGYLTTGEIIKGTNTPYYKQDEVYDVMVDFRLLSEADGSFAMVKPSLKIDKDYAMQVGARVIGKAILVAYEYYEPQPNATHARWIQEMLQKSEKENAARTSRVKTSAKE